MPTLPEIRIPMPEEENKTLYGSVGLTQNWDKNGRIFYTDEEGNKVVPNIGLNFFQKLGRKLQAGGKNFKDYIDNQDIHSDKYKRKVGDVALTAGTLGIGGGALGLTRPLWQRALIAGGENALVGAGYGAFNQGLNNFIGDKNERSLLQDMGQNALLFGTTGAGLTYGAGRLLNAINKFNNPWFVDDTLQNGSNVLKYMYDRIIPKNNKRLSKLETPEAIRTIRTAGSGHNGGIGVYTKRSYPNANDGVVATYYPTSGLTKTSKIQGWETPKFNELTPNNNETAQLYYDTLKGVKDKFGRAYDTVSLHPVEEYKNMRLFLSPDKTNGFAIKPDGDIVSVFGAKPGSGTSHSMLELALQNKGYKLDNYDVSRLRNLYDNHGFNVTEKMKWNDEFWDPKEWDKSFMQKEYGVAEPDITFREIYDKNIYPEIQRTSLFEKLIDAIK